MKKRLVMYCVCGMLAIITAYVFFNSSGIRAASDVKPYVDMLEQSHKGMTLWQLIKTGGVIMVFLGLLSMAAIACIIYNFRHLMVNKLLPQDFAESVIDKLNKRRFQLVEEICMSNDNLIAGFVQSGLQKADKGTLSVREAMERRARKDIASIWQNISYLSDIAMISPMTVYSLIHWYWLRSLVRSTRLSGPLAAANILRIRISAAADALWKYTPRYM